MLTPKTAASAKGPLLVLLCLWTLLCLGRGNVQEEIFTRPGSRLLLPIRYPLTLKHKDGTCDQLEWTYKDIIKDNIIIATHRGCKLTTNNRLFANTRISENGSLIINSVTLYNDGIYRVNIYNSRGDHIQRGDYIIHVEGNVQEEIFTRPGSDLLLPIRRHLTLNRKDGTCDEFEWKYKDPSRDDETKIVTHKGCELKPTKPLITNTKILENGSLIIDDVTLYNDGIYIVDIHNSRGDHIQKVYYIIHVEVPVSVPDLNVSCLDDGRAKISCKVENGTKLNISVSVIGGSQGDYSASSNNITATAGSPGPWSITCYVENHVSRETSKVNYTCPVPLSDIEVTSSCLPDGSAKAECSVNGSDPRYSWTMNGRSVSNESWVTLPPPASGTLRCDVTNQINKTSKSISINCPVPVSVPALNVSCLQNGSAKIFCRVEKGTNPSILLTVIGGLEVYNVTSSERSVHVTVPPVSPPDSWNISCLVKNNISNTTTNQIHDSCLAPLSTPHVNVSCHIDGSAHVSCVLEDDRDVTYNWTVNGKYLNGNHSRNITLSHGTFISGPLNVRCYVYRKESREKSNTTQISCPAPLSTPHVNVSCHTDGSANVSCVLEDDRDVTYNWTVNGKNLNGNHSRNIALSHGTFISGPLNVRCYVYRKESGEESNTTQISCPAPLSTPHVNVSCHNDGSVSATCVLEKDQDVTYTWTVDGEKLHGNISLNITFNKGEHNNTVPMNVSCSVYNSVTSKESNTTHIYCPGSCLSCLQKSLIWGSVALLVTMLPLFISHWYILRCMNKKS